jgi:type III pantothenate kinase
MTNLVVDIGNSSIKIAVFKQDKIIFSNQTSTLNKIDFYQLKEKHQIQNLIISSVKQEIAYDEEGLKKHFNYIRFNGLTNTPVHNKYTSPQTLGLDRLAAVVGAKYLFPNQHVMVIDAGTCITYDVLNGTGEYFGGSISPGINMRFEAMHHFTSKLPLVVFDKNFNKSFGVLYEAEGFIQTQLKLQPETKIILCGGDSGFFDSRFKNSIFAHLILHEPNLVLIGLNTVVNYKHDHK